MSLGSAKPNSETLSGLYLTTINDFSSTIRCGVVDRELDYGLRGHISTWG
jgi:hypothetical protein